MWRVIGGESFQEAEEGLGDGVGGRGRQVTTVDEVTDEGWVGYEGNVCVCVGCGCYYDTF